MHSQVKQRDICQTCIHAAHCAHHRHCLSLGKAIFYCENFDDQPALRVVEGEVLNDAKPCPEPSRTGVAYIRGRMKGLCVNCGNRATCKYPICDGGVWHCGEYC